MIKNCIIFGTGRYGREAFELLGNEYAEILFSDNDSSKWNGSFCNKKIICPKDIILLENYDVVIAILKQYAVVGKQLMAMGCKNIKIFVPYIDCIDHRKKCKLIDYYGTRSIGNINFEDDLALSNKNCTNKNDTGKILLIANEFPPQGGSGVQRSLKFAKYLPQYGYTPTVLTQGYISVTRETDYSLLDEIACEIIYIQNQPRIFEELDDYELSILFNLYYCIVQSKEWISVYLDYLDSYGNILPESEMIWVLCCIKEIDKRVNISEYPIVYTSSAPYSSHLLGYYLKTKYGIKWVMDYRDPWCLNEYGMRTYYAYRKKSWKLEKELEIKLLENADYVIGAGEVLETDFKKYISRIRYKTITNGYDEEDFRNVLNRSDNIFRIVFCGSVYQSYDYELIFLCVNELIEENIIDKSKIEIEIIGTISETKHNQIKGYDKYNVLIYNGYLNHRKCLECLSKSGILLLFGAYDEGAWYVYTGKIFEYLRMGKPIISFSSSYGLHYEMIEERGRGITVTYKDKEKIKNFVLKNYNYWKENGNTEQYEVDEFVKSFSRERLTGELARVFDEVR